MVLGHVYGSLSTGTLTTVILVSKVLVCADLPWNQGLGLGLARGHAGVSGVGVECSSSMDSGMTGYSGALDPVGKAQ